MAGKKISALSPLTPLDGTEEAVVEITGQNYRVTTQDIADLGGGGGGSTITIGEEPVSPDIGDTGRSFRQRLHLGFQSSYIQSQPHWRGCYLIKRKYGGNRRHGGWK